MEAEGNKENIPVLDLTFAKDFNFTIELSVSELSEFLEKTATGRLLDFDNSFSSPNIYE